MASPGARWLSWEAHYWVGTMQEWAESPDTARRAAFRERVALWFATAGDYLAAAYAYERLWGLSDAELQRRGLSRAEIARAACAASHRKRELATVDNQQPEGLR